MAFGPSEIVDLYNKIKEAEKIIDTALLAQGDSLVVDSKTRDFRFTIEVNLKLSRELVDAICLIYMRVGWTEVSSVPCDPSTDTKWQFMFHFER